MVYCTECGEKIPDGSSFCSNCGSEISSSLKEAERNSHQEENNLSGQESSPTEIGQKETQSSSQTEATPDTFLYRLNEDKPLNGGVLLMLAGLLLAYIPFYTLDNFAFTGETGELIGIIGLGFAIFVFLSGVASIVYPQISTLAGMVGIVISVFSLVGGTFGGMGVGTSLGVVGGALCVAWDSGYTLGVSRPFTISLAVSSIPFVWALQFWWESTELLAFWFGFRISVPVFVILYAVAWLIENK